ncbi:hypothetical protein [Nostoc sp.]|uniref:hypothetical protein n=1 Tax=Nostoc sp. TaxID=1180 RepID=UPI002FF473DC
MHFNSKFSILTPEFLLNCQYAWLKLKTKTGVGVGWGATALDGFPGLKQVAFEERNPTPTLSKLCWVERKRYPTYYSF